MKRKSYGLILLSSRCKCMVFKDQPRCMVSLRISIRSFPHNRLCWNLWAGKEHSARHNYLCSNNFAFSEARYPIVFKLCFFDPLYAILDLQGWRMIHKWVMADAYCWLLTRVDLSYEFSLQFICVDRNKWRTVHNAWENIDRLHHFSYGLSEITCSALQAIAGLSIDYELMCLFHFHLAGSSSRLFVM